ncbi:allophanate hydrolase [Niveispirillum cyanobacteriorum]|uniref:Allophanate hydrolase n=1 Tax=Niveispirillum cyanobacteriorum TaxID=1612173 RepID=A0A2K9NI72_9PROT|nr:allophanate hydrolase [Niveispirillum cyanobacteriorum]AUN32780.1 allophanate hydrolase [Niveispirillum cyanobacteriorum]GGE87718.1 allophanate hydrolase [Niveispirillum cyanobacteriorum]
MLPEKLTIQALTDLYRTGKASPVTVIEAVLERLSANPDAAAWISTVPAEQLRAEAAALAAAGYDPCKPLWGIPFAAKDNIDTAGIPTTAACPAFAFTPATDSTVVAKLRAAGAILVGKTNLDQFATGLNGTRSPYGAPRCVFDTDYISGGSSSGSAVVVARGQVAFALGTDTAGSGRVPASFNDLVGIKPSKGLLSTSGLVPACRSQDCITVLAHDVADGDLVRRVAEGFDAADPFSRAPQARPLRLSGFRFGVLTGAEKEFLGDHAAEALYDAAVERLVSLGGTAVPFDYKPLRECAHLLYGGPWVAERLAAIEEFFEGQADAMDPTVRSIVAGAQGKTAVEAFVGQYSLAFYAQEIARLWCNVDLLLLPTTPTIYTVADMLADPIRLNSNLGRYTNFVNLLDCAAVAVPAGFRPNGLPFGVTLIGPAFTDTGLAVLASRLHGKGEIMPTIPDDWLPIVVVGAHLSGMPLNHELTSVGGVKLGDVRTAPDYRFYTLAGTVPPKPGLVREPGFAGPGIAAEEWALPPAAFGQFVARIPAPLGVGKVTLDDGRQVTCFLCESHALAGATDITPFGGWRAYRASLG